LRNEKDQQECALFCGSHQYLGKTRFLDGNIGAISNGTEKITNCNTMQVSVTIRIL
jgi:hypothetical protein